jgi:hemolysin activation/secretion protein
MTTRVVRFTRLAGAAIAASMFACASVAMAQGVSSQPAPAQEAGAPAGPFYTVDRFAVAGLEAWGSSVADLGTLRVRLARTPDGWVAAAADDESVPVRTLRQIRGDGPVRLDDTALAQIAQGIPAWMLEALGKEYNGQRTPAYSVDEATGVATFTVEAPAPAPGESAYSVGSVRGEGLTEDGLSDEELAQVEVALTPVAGGFIDARIGLPVERRTLGDITAGEDRVTLYSSALQTIAESVVRAYNERDLRGIRVDVTMPDPGAGELVLRVTEGRVGDVRTIKLGDTDESTTNAPEHARIRESSPVQEGELVDIRALDNYVFRLNRRPGRRVDIALAPGPDQNELTLDFLVAEGSPLTLYAQASNTGTDETTEWRERFGLNHYNLTGADDTLLLDYVTGNFDSVNALLVSYERPFSFLSDWRVRGYATYTQYDASQVGFAGQAFEGETVGGGAEILWTFHQDRATFLDGVLGARFENVQVDNNLANTTADNDFFLPYIGVKAERLTEQSQTFGLAMIESNLPDVADTQTGIDLDGLGRINASDDWIVFRYELSHSFYLEPLLQKNWGGEGSTLAHEVYLSAKGQVSFDDRLPPNYAQTIGGLYTVRGYPEAFSFGDRVYQATAEYRYHFPRSLAPGEPVRGLFPDQPFRARPQQWLSRPDWDLIFRAFIDAGIAENIDKEAFENDTTLVGAGVGVELAIKRNFNVRVDWGFALHDEETADDAVTSGSSQVHLVFTLVF